jgi:hypothetical protein
VIKDRNHFPAWLTENGLKGTGCEVGTYYGSYAVHILTNWPGVLCGIDPYVNMPDEEWLDGCNKADLEEAMACAVNLLNPFGGRFLLKRKTSQAASCEFNDETLDFVYLDGNHDRKHVTQDILLWWPKIHPGGVLGGHDYYNRVDSYQRCEVMNVVDEFAREHPELDVILTDCTSWWIRKP